MIYRKYLPVLHFESAQVTSRLANQLWGLDDFHKGHGNSVTKQGWVPSQLSDKVDVERPDGIRANTPVVNNKQIDNRKPTSVLHQSQ